MKYAGIALALCLAGCELPSHPATTADHVLAAQYRARAVHGAITGGEAGKISDAYHQSIAGPPAGSTDRVTDTR